MKKIAFYDTKPYDTLWFDRLNHSGLEFQYIENKLNADTARLARDCEGVVAFVNDRVDREAIGALCAAGVKVIALRSAGFNNVDFRAAYQKITVLRVPSYSPNAVAEYAMGLLLALNRKIHKAYARTRENNFSLSGLTGFDLRGKTVGVVGTGQIGRVFLDICRGFQMDALAYDPSPAPDLGVRYVPLDTLYGECKIISLHCPLTRESHHMINAETIGKMRDGVYLINTSRGALVESGALLRGLKSKKIGGAALDVYEEESALFFEDFSQEIISDDTLSLLISLPNVILTSHQAFLTEEALKRIAETTIENLSAYFAGAELPNEICYQCGTGTGGPNCPPRKNGRCF